jgi:HSP20 family molecular chaperone IbpA
MANVEIQRQEPETKATSVEATRPGRTYRPNVDIVESDEGLRLWADMPGVDEKSIEIELADGVLAIRGRVATEEYENLRPVYTEYNVGDYEARFRLSSSIDEKRIAAKLANGVLEVELPKSEAAKPRRIQIN